VVGEESEVKGGYVMRTRFNKNDTVTISQMPRDLYWAIDSILRSSERAFEWNEEESAWWSNTDFICELSPKEKEMLDKHKWSI
jgi:hypothetical protein